MNAVFVIIWLIAMVIAVMLRRYWMHNNRHIGYLYVAYGLAAVFIAVLVALASIFRVTRDDMVAS